MNYVENRESQQPEQKDTLATMIKRKFGIDRNTFKVKNTDRLAKMAGVSTEEYIRARQNDAKKNAEYNGIIRKNILANKLVPLQEYSKVLQKFSPQQQAAITKAFSNSSTINTYLGSLTDIQITEFKKLSFIQLVGFLKQEIKKIQTKKEYVIKNNIQENGIAEFAEQFLVLDELDNIANKINTFITKNKLQELEIDEQTGKFIDADTEKKYQIFFQTLSPKDQQEYERIKTKSGEVAAQKYLRTVYQTKIIQTSEIQSKLSDEARAEFAGIVDELHTISQKMGIDVFAFGLQAMYQEAKAYLIQKYTTTPVYQTLISNIQSNTNVSKYFTDNKIQELVPENIKDKAYYTKLLSWYPVMDGEYAGKKISEYFSYLNENMTIKKETPDDQKKLIVSLLPQLRNQGKPYEDKLLSTTNILTQEVAIQQCITTLQSYMDVNISQKENMLEQLKIVQNRDAVSENLVLHIKGNLKGKKVNLSYNLLSGTISYQSFLTKRNTTDQAPLVMGSSENEDEVPLITLPKFGDFIIASQQVDYKTCIENSSTKDLYAKNISEILQDTVKKNQDMANQKDMLKKYIIKDTIMQNIYQLTGKRMDQIDFSYTITPNAQPEIYALYNFIYKSLEYYSMESIDQLQLFQKNINTLLTYREQNGTQTLESIDRTSNPEMFVLQTLTNKSSIRDNIPANDPLPEKKLKMFFDCFAQQTSGISIVDGEMMDNYITAAQGNSPKNKVGKWSRTGSFTMLVDTLSNNQEITDLEQKIQNLT